MFRSRAIFPYESRTMLNGNIKGVVVPTVTPLTPDERVDTTSLRRLVNYLIDEGAHGIWAAGTTGEFAALRDDQRLLAIEKTAEEVNGRVPVIRQRFRCGYPGGNRHGEGSS